MQAKLNAGMTVSSHTTVRLIAAIGAVSFPVTQEAAGNAAALVITLVRTALHVLVAFQFI